MLGFAKNLCVRRSWSVALIFMFVALSAPQVFAEVGADEGDVGVLEDVSESDVEEDVEELEDVSDLDIEEEDVSDLDVADEDVLSGFDGGGANDAEESEPEFLLVNLQVEVLFDDAAPASVTLGLSGNLGTIESEDVQVSEQGQALWEIEELRAGAWTLSAVADGYEPVSYRFVAGESSQMTVRISMLEVGRVPEVKVESGWGCSAVAADAMPSTLILLSALAGGMLVQRRRKRR